MSSKCSFCKIWGNVLQMYMNIAISKLVVNQKPLYYCRNLGHFLFFLSSKFAFTCKNLIQLSEKYLRNLPIYLSQNPFLLYHWKEIRFQHLDLPLGVSNAPSFFIIQRNKTGTILKILSTVIYEHSIGTAWVTYSTIIRNFDKVYLIVRHWIRFYRGNVW